MINKAKVSLSAVKSFHKAVKDIVEYSEHLEQGINCLEKLGDILSENIPSLNSSIENMQAARENLAVKISETEENISSLNAQIAEIQEEIDSVEEELEETDSTYTETDEEGNTEEFENPEYSELEERLSDLEDELNSLQSDLYDCQQRLEEEKDIDGQLVAHIDVIEGVIFSIQEKVNACQQMQADVEDIKNAIYRRSANAEEGLGKIDHIITEYIRTKMVYENVVNQKSPEAFLKNWNSAISTNNNQEQQKENSTMALSKQEIQEHHVKFDTNNHICEYDGYRYGGTYNSYEDRLSGTSAENPILGYYEGIRGESKYIPTGRTAEGVVVKDILSRYGVDGIIYRNAEPAFEVCADAIVQIDHMSEYRYDPDDSEEDSGNFTQADIKCADLWNLQKKDGKTDWEARDVKNYREANRYTWHEKCDTKTMILMPREINAFFQHYGGVSECRMRDSGLQGEEEFDE